ncbi:unnamed protein product [Clonostachys rosea f. rosea IK726]|uniref:Uncharacterized protein n=1 Tax=Clonostachys rosea f. rosea IK726 TaxID=1349383 RepID=A0ACA9TLB9_BIOOC|nr:unnamed protein product [Clonostachys rosea f. rosea IK726]
MKFFDFFSVSFVLLSAGTSALKPYPQDANAVRRRTLVGTAPKVPAHIARARLPSAQAARPKVKTPSPKAVGAKRKKTGAASKPKALACKVKGKLGKRAVSSFDGCHNDDPTRQGCTVAPNPGVTHAVCGGPSPSG